MRLKYIFMLLLSAFLVAQNVYADSIIFLPDPSKSIKKMEQDNTDTIPKNSNMRLFDIQTKDFNPKESRGFKVLPNNESSKENQQDSIKLPQEMQQEELPTDYSNAFKTSMRQQNNIETNSLLLAQNTNNINHHKNSQDNMKTVANGATLIIESKQTKPQALYLQNKEFPWVSHPKNSKKKIAFITIPYKTNPGILKLNSNVSIKVVQGEYKKEKINIVDTSKTKPNKVANERISKELAEANAIYRKYTKQRYWNKPFALPLDSIITSPFGSARVFNNEIRSFHGGTDFRAKIGTPIHASNDGIVVISKERFLAGKSVVIDHGEGIYSMYYHCSDLKVKVGQKVQKGQVVALSGDTGRVSGAHLHFGILVNGIQVDPIDFINKVNALF